MIQHVVDWRFCAGHVHVENDEIVSDRGHVVLVQFLELTNVLYHVVTMRNGCINATWVSVSRSDTLALVLRVFFQVCLLPGERW